MAAIENSIQLYDGMAAPVNSMIKSTDALTRNYRALGAMSGQMINMASLNYSKTQITQINVGFQRMAEEVSGLNEKHQQLNASFTQGGGAARRLWGSIKGIASNWALQGTKGLIGLSDQLSQNTSKLNLMNDGLQTTDELNQMIYESAQRSRSPFINTAQAVSQFGLNAGKAFASTQETVDFAEQINKRFTLAGASQQQMNDAMSQMASGLGTGVLSGAELDSVVQVAPNIAQDIAGVMGVDVGQLQSLAAQGQITAEIVKQAMFSTADETNKKFETMPKTFGQIWSMFTNEALVKFKPALDQLSQMANGNQFQQAVSGIINGLSILAQIAVMAFGLLVKGIEALVDNWPILGPIILGVASALAMYKAVAMGVAIVQALMNAQKTITATIESYTAIRVAAANAALAGQTAATIAQSTAQYGLNAALMACPITWIVLAIIALIMLLYVGVAAINKFAGTSLSATGIICGAFRVAAAVIGNILITLFNLGVGVVVGWVNFFGAFANFFANFLNDPAGSIVRLIGDMADSVLSIIENIANAIDTVFGSNLASSVRGWRNGLSSFITIHFGEQDKEIYKKLDPQDYYKNRLDYGKEWGKGYGFGKNLSSKFKLPSLDQLLQNDSSLGYEPPFIPGTEDSPLGQNMAATAGNTGRMADSMELSEEDVKYLRDVAERDVINRFTTAELSVSMNTTANINSGLDIDGVISQLENKTYETLLSAVEGVY